MKAAASRPHSAGHTRKSELGEGGICERLERHNIDAWGRRGRDRWGAAEDSGAGKSFCGLKSRVVEAVVLSSDFIDDIKCLRRARGPLRRSASARSLSATGKPSGAGEGRRVKQKQKHRQLTKHRESKEAVSSAQDPKGTNDSSRIEKRTDHEQKIDMMGFDKTTEGTHIGNVKRQGIHSRKRPLRWSFDGAFMNSTIGDDDCFPPSSTTAQYSVTPSLGAALPSQPGVAKQKMLRRIREDGERLRRAVQDTIYSTLEGRTGGHLRSASGRRRGRRSWNGREFHTPQWSQKHEALLSDLKRRMREAGSPLVQAKDPAILIGALLRREPAAVAQLDKWVLDMEGKTDALDALIVVAGRLRDVGVSADTIFTRAGVVRTGGSFRGSKPIFCNSDATTEGGKGVEGGRETMRCTIKRVHAEIQRVLGGDVASYKEFCTALKACLKGGQNRGKADAKERGGEAMEWITIDELDHVLRTCHNARWTLDRQGASHPPLTGNRVARFLEAVRRSTKARKGPFYGPLHHVVFTSRGTSPSSIRGKAGTAKQTERVRRAHARVEKWTADDRELAEREMAGAIVERQEKFVGGYVEERRCYLDRRVAAQRQGLGKFQTDGGSSESRIEASPQQKLAAKAEFKEAVDRTKTVLKELERKVASRASCVPSPGATPTVATRTRGKRNQAYSANLERRPTARVRFARPRATTHAAPDRKDPVSRRKDRNGTSRERSVCAILRRSTEEYGDRVGKYGGGGAKHGMVHRYPLPIPRGSSTEGAIAAGAGGDTATGDAAVLSVQAVFRQRMFHRLVWAQRYLRRPTHAFSIFKRACRPCLLASANIQTYGDVASTAVRQSTDTTFEDLWPEAPGFNPSTPYHTHAADSAFFKYLTSRRQVSTTSRGRTQLDAHGQAVGLELSSAPEATPPPRTQGMHFFARKYAIHTEAMRSTLLNLHLPFIPGALDAAMDDLESIIDAGTSVSAGDHVAGSSHKATLTRSGVERARIRNRQQSYIAHRRQELSFSSWYEWWLRHLPYDIGSPTYMLKTIRCAQTLHSAEVAANANANAEAANTYK